MKKIAMLFFFVLVFAALLTFTALADGEPLTTNKDGTVSYTTADGKVTGYTAACTQDVVAGNQYVLLVVKAPAQGEQISISENTIMYIDQKAAGASGIEFADFMPRSTPDCVVLLGGTFSDGESPKTLGTIAGQGVTVSGTVTSYGTNAEVTVKLNDESKTVTSTLVEKVNSKDPDTFTGSFTFDSVSDGTYTLSVSKKSHVTREYEITVAGDEITCNAVICLLGDITQDGQVNTLDLLIMRQALVDNITLDSYQNGLADVNGISPANTLDLLMLRQHLVDNINIHS